MTSAIDRLKEQIATYKEEPSSSGDEGFVSFADAMVTAWTGEANNYQVTIASVEKSLRGDNKLKLVFRLGDDEFYADVFKEVVTQALRAVNSPLLGEMRQNPRVQVGRISAALENKVVWITTTVSQSDDRTFYNVVGVRATQPPAKAEAKLTF